MSDTRKSAELLVAAIEVTGGLLQFSDGTVAPQGDHDWIDLGDAYLLACAELQRLPVVRLELESQGDSVGISDKEAPHRD
jgi:hypothetical protein